MPMKRMHGRGCDVCRYGNEWQRCLYNDTSLICEVHDVKPTPSRLPTGQPPPPPSLPPFASFEASNSLS